MGRMLVGFLAGIVSVACGNVGSRPETAIVNDQKASPSPTVEAVLSRPADVPLLVSVKPSVQLSPTEQRYLDRSIPPEVRAILESSEKFDVLGEIDKKETSEGDFRSFAPNRLVAVSTDATKKEILEALYHDASKEDSPAECYEPRHAIRASHKDKSVEVEICFSCSRFVIKFGSQEYTGTIVRENGRSEGLFERIFTK